MPLRILHIDCNIRTRCNGAARETGVGCAGLNLPHERLNLGMHSSNGQRGFGFVLRKTRHRREPRGAARLAAAVELEHRQDVSVGRAWSTSERTVEYSSRG